MAKGIVEEIFSEAIHHTNPKDYSIFYRNFEKSIKVSLVEFMEISNNFQTIPANRIERITKNGTTLFERIPRK